jgi:hypothetical protein
VICSNINGYLRNYQDCLTLVQAQKTAKGTEVLSVQWNNNKVEAQYPAVWLRDNCQCPKCYQNSALARKLVMKDLDAGISMTEPKLCPDSNEVFKKQPPVNGSKKGTLMVATIA